MPDERSVSRNVASIFTNNFLATIYGRTTNLEIGDSGALISALRADRGATLTLVEVNYIRAAELCVPVSTLLILPGEGEELTEEDTCVRDKDLRKWQFLPDQKLPVLHIGSASPEQLIPHSRRKAQIKGASIQFGDIQLNGSIISVNMFVRWTENILGNEVTIIDQTFPFRFDLNVQNPYPIHLADIEGPLGIPISVDATISVQLNPNQICADLRATWLGGNVGTRSCQGF